MFRMNILAWQKNENEISVELKQSKATVGAGHQLFHISSILVCYSDMQLWSTLGLIQEILW